MTNLAKNCTVDHVKAHCKNLNIRVLWRFDVSNVFFNSKAFKLAVPVADVNKVLDEDLWPRFVTVRPWGTSLIRGEREDSVKDGYNSEGKSIAESIVVDDRPSNL